MMAIIQQWLTLLLAHIDWVGQPKRINRAITTLNHLTGPSPDVLEHLVQTRAALNLIKLKAELSGSTASESSRAMYSDLLETAVVLIQGSTISISSRDVDDDVNSLQVVTSVVQTDLTEGFARIQLGLREMQQCYHKLSADLLWEYQASETMHARQIAAAGAPDSARNTGRDSASNLVEPSRPDLDNLDKYLERVGGLRCIDLTPLEGDNGAAYLSPFRARQYGGNRSASGSVYLSALLLSAVSVLYFPSLRSFRGFAYSFVVFSCISFATVSAQSESDMARSFLSEELRQKYTRRQPYLVEVDDTQMQQR